MNVSGIGDLEVALSPLSPRTALLHPNALNRAPETVPLPHIASRLLARARSQQRDPGNTSDGWWTPNVDWGTRVIVPLRPPHRPIGEPNTQTSAQSAKEL